MWNEINHGYQILLLNMYKRSGRGGTLFLVCAKTTTKKGRLVMGMVSASLQIYLLLIPLFDLNVFVQGIISLLH